ncbi:hypothetical protein ACS0TY_035038 [Phlomoides rotata]
MDLFPGLPYDLGLECLIRVPPQCLSSVSSVSRTWKREIQLPEFWRRRKASGFTRKVIFMSQSRDDPTRRIWTKKYAAPVYGLTLCDPESGFWEELPPGPWFPHGLPMFCHIVGVGLSVVVMGGLDPVTFKDSRGVFIYSPVSATWRRGAHMPGCSRSFFACASDSDRTVFVAGGHDTNKDALKSAMAYDVEKDEWIMLPEMTRERDEPKGVFHRGEFHVIGGYPTEMQGSFEATAESFNVATWQWGPVQEDFLDAGACPRNCVGNGDGMLVTCRGTNVMERRGSTWTVAAELPPDVKYTAFVIAWQGKVLVIGSEESCKTFIMWDFKRGKWEGVDCGENFSGYVQSGCCLEL